MGVKTKILKELGKKPRRAKELKAKMGNDKKVMRALAELERQGRVEHRCGIYSASDPSARHAVKCTIVKLAGRFGFARPEDPEKKDIFIPGRDLMGAMPGDTVLVAEKKGAEDARHESEGRVIAILHENNRFTGTVEAYGPRLLLIPDACPKNPVLIKKSADGGARPGDRAAAEILERGMSHDDHRAGISMLFGSALSAISSARALVYGAGLSKSFPAKVKAEAKKLEGAIVTAEEMQGRRDLRNECIFTIDSAETKDIDDAVSIRRTDNGYCLGVHIADVSHYVRPESMLDREAFRRGTSVYYADEVIPMLPRQLSNGICSLNEGEDRLAFSCLMELDEGGRLIEYHFEKSVIRSRLKAVYKEVNLLLDETADERVKNRYDEIRASLLLMLELYRKLAKLRSARGAMEIESSEAKLLMDTAGRCIGVEKRERGEAERMIEEFMLLANTSAASLARRMKIPFVFRTHEPPDPERMEMLKKTLTALRVDCCFAEELPTTLELAKLLSDTRGTPIERAVHTNVLRSMAKAKYEPLPKGHFGLGLADYAHFTSPIRRYPDLAIHRILSDVCSGMEDSAIREKYTDFAARASLQSSERELAAMTLERDIEDCYIAEYMGGHIGEEMQGVISSVARFGIYVELPNTVEGMIRAQALSENELILQDGAALIDPAAGKEWRIGEPMRIRVAGVDIPQGNIDFVPADYRKSRTR